MVSAHTEYFVQALGLRQSIGSPSQDIGNAPVWSDVEKPCSDPTEVPRCTLPSENVPSVDNHIGTHVLTH